MIRNRLAHLSRWRPLVAASLGSRPVPRRQPRPASPVAFTDVTARSGVTFRHTSGAFGKKYLPETMGSGVVVLDVDNDGRQDLFFVNGKDLAGTPAVAACRRSTATPAAARSPTSRRAAGLAVRDVRHGRRGRRLRQRRVIDLFVTALGGNRLFRNTGKGAFEDVTQRAGVGRAGFSSSAAWFDYDKDGRLDLIVANYVQWQLEKDIHCTLDGKTKSYCTPESYKGETPFLFRNLGNGTFEDATTKAGLNDPASKGLGIGLLDYNADGWLDVFVANDTQPNRLYRNTGKGTFVDEAVTGRRGLQRSGRGARRHGRGRGRLRRIRAPGTADRQLLERDAVALSQRRQRAVHRRGALVQPRPRIAAVADLRVLLLRCRQRRPARHLHRQRARRRRHQPRPAEGHVRAGRHTCTATRARPASRTSLPAFRP